MTAKDEADALAVAIALRASLAKLNRRLRAQDEPRGAGSTALSILGRLYRDGPASATLLAASESLQPQSLTRTLQTLEKRALITRAADYADRRRSTITITPAGIEVLRRSARNREAWLARAMVAALSTTERELLRLTALLIERLAETAE